MLSKQFSPQRTGLVLVLLAALCSAVARAQVWPARNRLLYDPSPHFQDFYGRAVAVGDFNADGRDDLAVGEPGTAVNSQGAQGLAIVYLQLPVFGGGTALFRSQSWNDLLEQGTLRVGSSLAVGDFDGTPPDELAVGAPYHDDGAFIDSGGVAILYFQPEGVFARILEESDLGVDENYDDHFGTILAVGDFDGDGFDDLAVGVPESDDELLQSVGRVDVFYGSVLGLITGGAQSFHLADLGESNNEFDNFGKALAAGDFDRGGNDDLAIGVPGRDVSFIANAGEVLIVYGSDNTGLDAARIKRLDEGWVGLTLTSSDRFGEALAAGDFNGPGAVACFFVDCADDLAIGIPGDDVNGVDRAGRVSVLFGVNGLGLSTASPQHLDQSAFGFNLETADQFGAVLVAGQLDGLLGGSLTTAADDLIIGVPFEDLGNLGDAGVAHLVLGSPTGLSVANSQLQAMFGDYGGGSASFEERFGSAIAVGDFDDDGSGDVAFGMSEHYFGATQAGIVQVLFGGLCSDGFERGDTSAWSRRTP